MKRLKALFVWGWRAWWPLVLIGYVVVIFCWLQGWLSWIRLLLAHLRIDVSETSRVLGQLGFIGVTGLLLGYLCWKWLGPIAAEYDDDVRWIGAAAWRGGRRSLELASRVSECARVLRVKRRGVVRRDPAGQLQPDRSE